MPKRYESHDFYCLKCGEKVLPLARCGSRLKEKFHRKKLYCWHCKEEINCVECRNLAEIEEFRENFMKGEYKDEAEASLAYVRSSRLW